MCNIGILFEMYRHDDAQAHNTYSLIAWTTAFIEIFIVWVNFYHSRPPGMQDQRKSRIIIIDYAEI